MINDNYQRPGLRPPGRKKSCPKLSPPRNEFSQSPPGKPLKHSIRLISKRWLAANAIGCFARFPLLSFIDDDADT
ncbi:hypothetical protein DERF_006178 [Dermatophagoides farinae]|uniref:Uncharacterized protein n=1 Tax=Dermatophagoides farinae TaxID=6954 RepID=A0A922L9F9_DERFA|nr:hypothetical protein DERF_006178 [Dermatophagoides farinae]